MAAKTDKPAAHPRLALAASILASSTAFVDGSDVNVALPAIARDLSAGPETLQWIVNAYLLLISGLLLMGGALGDKFGRRRLFLIGCVVFGLATALCTAAPNLPLLLAGRALQGLGSALLLPNSLALIGAHFSGEERGRAIGIWAAAGAVSGAVGPMIAGWMVETLGWRSVFLIDLPLAVGALLLGWRYVEESREEKSRPLDIAGVAVGTAALGLLALGLTRLAAETPHLDGLGWTGAGIACLIGFVALEHRRGDDAIMPLSMFGTSSFIGLTLLTFFLYAALGGLFVLLPYVLIQLNGYSPLLAGAALLPMPLIIAAASPFMGQLAARIGPKWFLSIGPMVTGLGFALLVRMGADANYWTDILPGLLVVAIGMAGAVAPLTTAVNASVDGDHVGTANGFNSAIARTGGLIATALLGSVLGAEGERLGGAFHLATLVAAGAAVLAGLSALLLLKSKEVRTPE